MPQVAGVIQRCYTSVEAATGRVLDGGVLLFILHYPERPRAYRFRAEVSEEAHWNEVRIAFVEGDETLLGPHAGEHLSTFLHDTLPHELGHDLLANRATLRHDGHGQSPCGTRWFIEGVCEVLAKGFAREENPEAWRRALKRRRAHSLPRRPAQADLVWNWGQENDLSPQDESDLYGWAHGMVAHWSGLVSLSDLLALMESRGGGYDGKMLIELLRETTGLDPDQLMDRVRRSAGHGPYSLLIHP